LEKFLINKRDVIINGSSIIINGEESQFEIHKLSEDISFLRVNGKNYILGSETENGTYTINYKGKKIEVDCKNEKDLIRERLQGGKKSKKFSSEIKSPMPGAIVKLNVKEGDEISKGDVLLVLEAMKMENEIKATHNCKIKKINVKEKDNVDKGQILITFE